MYKYFLSSKLTKTKVKLPLQMSTMPPIVIYSNKKYILSESKEINYFFSQKCSPTYWN